MHTIKSFRGFWHRALLAELPSNRVLVQGKRGLSTKWAIHVSLELEFGVDRFQLESPTFYANTAFK